MIFVDSNVPMYLVGPEHPHEIDAQRMLERCVAQERLTDVEVVQEILHRYAAIRRRDAIQPAVEALLRVVDEVIPADLAVVLRARDVVLGYTNLSARDALHVAVMERHRVDTIMTFDRGYDAYPGVKRFS